MDVEDRLDEARLRRPELEVDEAWARVHRKHQRHRRRAMTVVGGVVAVVVVVAAAVAFTLVDTDDPDDQVATDATGTTAPPAPTFETGWSEMAMAPLAPRVEPAAVMTDDELVVWGGRGYEDLGDGAAYDVTDDRWRTMADSPLSPQADAVAVWTGTEVVVWGDVHGFVAEGSPTSEPATDAPVAAAWDPALDRWRTIDNPLVLGASATFTGAAWTGTELVLLGVSGPANAFLPSDAYAIDPATGEARPVDPIPRRPNWAYGPRPPQRIAFATSDDVLLVSVADGLPVTIDRLDVASGTWATTVDTAVDWLDVTTDDVAWTGSELVIAPRLVPGVAFDPSTGAQRELAPSGSSLGLPAVALSEALVTVGDRYLDLDANVWRSAEAVPGPYREGPVALAHAGALYVVGGDGCGPGANCVEIVDPGRGVIWRPSGDDGGVDGPVMYGPRPDSAVSEYALLAGELQREGDCLYVLRGDAPADRAAVLWPWGTTWSDDDDAVHLADGSLLQVGGELSAGGGGRDIDQLRQSGLPNDVVARAQACSAADHGVFFIQTAVEVVDPG